MQKKVVAAEARVGQAFSGYLPALSLSANYAKDFSSPMTTTFGGVPVSFGIDEAGAAKGWQATLSQNLLTFGRLESSLDIARAGAESVKLDLRKAKQDLVFSVSNAFYGCLKAAKAYELAQKSVGMASSHFDQASAMLKAGTATKADVLRFDVARLSAQQTLIRAKNSLEISKASLNALIGNDLDSDVILVEPDFDKNGIVSEVVNNTAYSANITNAYQTRPDVKQALLGGQIARDSAALARAELLPAVVLQGSYGWRNTNFSNSSIKYDTTSWTVAAAASWKLFDGFGTAARINEANANYDAALWARRAAERAAALEIKSAYLDFVSESEMIDSAEKGVESARENLEISELRFKNGLSSNIEVIDAQSSFVKAELDLMSAKYDLLLSKARLDKACGISDANQLTGSNANRSQN